MSTSDDEFPVRIPEKAMTTRGMRGKPTPKVLGREDFAGTTERMEETPCDDQGEPKELRF